jgi:fyn-related kinase
MDEYRFVEQPSKDFFCPVTMGLLLQPHLTSCCGKHLSQEAAAKIRREKLPCPLCKKAQWNTMLDKRFRREVNALHVCCRHEGRGCGWQGEMTTFHTHIKSCPMGCDAPLNTSDDRATLGPGPEDFNVTEKSQAEETNDSFYVPEGPLYVALYDFEQRTSESLAFSKGEKLEIISEEEGDWWRARSLNSLKEGYIPRQYVAKCDTLAAEDWYFGNIRKREAERLLQIHHVRGMFLVRESESKLGDFTLSLYDGDNVKHYHIRRPDDEAIYYIASRAVFKSIRELVEHHSKDSNGLVTVLTAPCPPLEKPLIDLSHKSQEEWEIARDSIAFGRKLGCGWFGEVWEGKWNQIMPVAIRTFKNGIIEPQPFRQEAALMKTLQHPNLVQLYAICMQEEPLMMIMELMSQGSLLEFLHKGEGRSLKLPGLVNMAIQVAAGMEYLEEQGYIHGDLAARNVLVGDLNICKISDVGLSRLDKEDDFDGRTRLPIKWMAPEAALYNRFSTSSDMWSFGVLLTELLTHGRIPYPGMSNSEVLQKLQDGYRMPPPPNTPDKFYQIMLDTWRHNPEERPRFEAIKWSLEDSFATDFSYREPGAG